MTDPIDYSRPVGWWCPVCGWGWPSDLMSKLKALSHEHPLIPRYLPIPEGQRPLVEDEVATGEAEVVTFQFDDDNEMAISSVHPRGGRRTMGVMRWQGISIRSIEIHINDCAQASARARIVTGATE